MLCSYKTAATKKLSFGFMFFLLWLFLASSNKTRRKRNLFFFFDSLWKATGSRKSFCSKHQLDLGCSHISLHSLSCTRFSLSLFLFQDWVSLCIPGFSGTHSVNQACFKLTKIHFSASWVLGFQVCATITGASGTIFYNSVVSDPQIISKLNTLLLKFFMLYLATG